MLLEFGSSMDAGSIRNLGLELQSSSSSATRSNFLQFWGFDSKESRFSTTNVHQDRLSCTAHGTAWYRIVDRSELVIDRLFRQRQVMIDT